MRKLVILCLIIAWASPTPIQAKQDPLVFQIDETLNQPKVFYVSPSLNELRAAKTVQVAERVPTKKSKTKSVKTVVRRHTKFAAGYCTDYVAQKATVTWSGNANRWIVNATAQGYIVNHEPTAGAILVTAESKYGHVAYIETVNGSKVTISEWNVKGRFTTSTRTLDISNPIIKGVIHLN